MARTDPWDRSSQRALPLWLPIVVGVLIVARVISSRFEVTSPVDLVRWVPAAGAERLAKATHRPLLYEFSAEWCGPCHVLEADVFRDPKLAALINDQFVPVKLIDRQREEGKNPADVQRLQDQFSVSAFPTVVIVRAGSRADKVVGYSGKSNFESFLRGNH